MQRYQLLKIVNFSKLRRTTVVKLTLEKKEGTESPERWAPGVVGIAVTMVDIFRQTS